LPGPKPRQFLRTNSLPTRVGDLENSLRRVIEAGLGLVNHRPVNSHLLGNSAAVRLVNRTENCLQICGESRLHSLEQIQEILVNFRLAPTRSLDNLIDRNDPVVRIRHLGYLQFCRVGGSVPSTKTVNQNWSTTTIGHSAHSIELVSDHSDNNSFNYRSQLSFITIIPIYEL
jgi:hypothetical protein